MRIEPRPRDAGVKEPPGKSKRLMETNPFWIALNLIPGMGARIFHRLIEKFGSPEEALLAAPEEWERIGGEGLVSQRRSFDWERALKEELQAVRDRGIRVVSFQEEEYPRSLRNIHHPPPVLYIEGGLEAQDGLSLAVVGTRRPSPYGRLMTERLCRELAGRGMTIVSGMARGIDSAAHRVALDSGGRTLAVLGCGLANNYPRENEPLRAAIGRQGAVFSEFPMGRPPLPQNFPVRNRLISGLALGTLVVEAGEKSGALITAGHAVEQGREVFAVPGNVDSPISRGANSLIKRGAKLVEEVEDILEELPPPLMALMGEREARESPSMAAFSPEESAIYNLLCGGSSHIDNLIEESGLDAGRVSAILMELELKGLVVQYPGKMFSLK